MLDIGIDNQLASDYGICMVERPVIPTAEQQVEHIEVSGRHGSLTKKGAFKDVPLKIKFNMLEEENIKPLIRRMKAWLMNGKTLYFTDDDVYRKIKHVVVGDIVNEMEEHGEFEVEFTLDPFEYVTTVPLVLTKPEIILNYGTIESFPKLEVYGNGDIRIMINEVSFQIKGVNNSVMIDSELLIAYTGALPIKTIGEYPIFKVGENSIWWSGAVNRILIEPRWRYL
ncbi:gp13 protein [Bacillus thuringiensis serovar tolworthi]|uniref:Gp13 protein n=2 Tax=Bacillus cereus group TaxID=86661 RepID=A0A9W3ZT81_BACTO|nr:MULTISPECIES: distal tail protein Dit [Bacillus cereus group]MEB9594831.1 phage tail protein [Bacillus cereus]MRC49295.1 phage tail protein [Bacillus thuringiensis]MRD27628.1 phage tail protein [Bacillus thuringiensis]BAR81512.1 gp13 protein [Bacillus thuringiensis serovar tolworthi]